MYSIGFKNFRRFVELESLRLAPISIFVGGNNSGKSTVVKGILSIISFLRQECDIDVPETDFAESEDPIDFPDRGRRWISHNQRFRFNANYFAHIGTFRRALRCGAETNDIVFRYGLGSAYYEVVVTMDDESDEATSGRVSHLLICYRYGCVLKVDLVQWKAELTFKHDDPEKYRVSAEEYEKDSPQYDSLMKRYNYYNSFDEDVCISPFSLPDNIPLFVGPSQVIKLFARAIAEQINVSLNRSPVMVGGGFIDENYKIPINDEIKEFIISSPFWSEQSGFRFPLAFDNEEIEYIYAHAVTQSIIYSAKDTNDYLVKTVHDFANCRISHTSKGDKAIIYRFILRWMKEFMIGTDYSVRTVGGEAHIVRIKNMNDDYVNMADMGMGSIQLMILLFRIAAVLNKSLKQSRTTIILEEPEQNLHPMLQSKLADFVLEVHKEYGLHFIVETHSEYLIRKTQVLVGRDYNTPEKLDRNPFRVFYFPSSGQQPYDMGYTTSGKFSQPFGEGFFDEAANLHMTVLKNARK